MTFNDAFLNAWSLNAIDVGENAGSFGTTSYDLVEDFGGMPVGSATESGFREDLSYLDSQLQRMVDRVVDSLEKESFAFCGRYISDVFACNSNQRAHELAGQLVKRLESFRRGIAIVSVHGDHVHTVHDCPWSNQSCRCSFKKFPEAEENIRPILRRHKHPRYIETLKRSDWKNIVKYFCAPGYKLQEFKVHGVHQSILHQIAGISDAYLSCSNGGKPTNSLEECKHTSELNPEREGESLQAPDGPIRCRKRKHQMSAGGERGIRGQCGIIYDLLRKIAICPLSEIVFTKEYLVNPELAIKRLDDRDVKNIIDTHASVINTWSIEEFEKFYNNPNIVKIWSSRNVEMFDNYYFSIDISKQIIEQLLFFQFGNNLDKIKTFCTDVYDILEMNRPKTNCLVVISPPSAGKNYFFDAVLDYFLNVGHMTNPSKNNQFAYQDCHNRRVIMWNEPNYEPRETENLKKLFGGDTFSINVKCKPQAIVKRTPVIVLCNHYPQFYQNPAFRDRCIFYNWQSASFLKECVKKPRPDVVMNFILENKNTT